MLIETTSFGKDYKVHGCHNRSFDNEKLLSEFGDDNIVTTDSSNTPVIWVNMRKTYDDNWKAPKIITIKDISEQDSSRDQLETVGYIDFISWDVDPEAHYLVLKGFFNNFEKPSRNLETLMQSGNKIYFEPVADDELKIQYIRPYILVSLEGFYGQYKYYL